MMDGKWLVRRRSRVFAGFVLVLMLLTGGEITRAADPAQTVPPEFSNTLLTSLEMPTDLEFTPDGRLLLTQQAGQLLVWTGTVLLPPALDLGPLICYNRERGLLGVTIDPNFESNHHIYLYYTFKNNSLCHLGLTNVPVNRLSRFTLSDNNTVDLASEVVLLDNIPSPNGIHNAGDLSFGKDGYLYVSVGDGGCHYIQYHLCGESNMAARQPHVLLGKILRITHDGEIPLSNPYRGADSVRCHLTGHTDSGKKCQEIFAMGLRNPFRFAFDPNADETRFFINDVGAARWEEINVGQVGADYGWNIREGHCVTGSYENCGAPPAGMVNPIFDYPHTSSCKSITGGAFVPDGAWPAEFNGAYVFGDWVCGRMSMLVPDGAEYTLTEFLSEGGGITAMNFGPDRALYYLVYGFPGEVRRIEYIGSGNRAPIAVLSANPTFGGPPLTVTFDGSGSSDPDAGDTLHYHWAFGDGVEITGTVSSSIVHTYTEPGAYTAGLQVSDSHGQLAAVPALLRIDVGNTPPIPSIQSPDPELRFAVNEIYTMIGSATDAEDGELPENRLAWEVRRHHNEHFHPYVPHTVGNRIEFEAPPPEELTPDSQQWLEILLTATDSQGLSKTVTRTLQANVVPIVIATEPPGVPLNLNGVVITTPLTLNSWEAFAFDIAAPQTLEVPGQILNFASWSDGGAAAHTIVTPASPVTYTATFTSVPQVTDLIGLDNIVFDYWLSSNPAAPAGVLQISLILRNTSPSELHDLFFKIRNLGGGNLMLNAVGGPGGVGATITVPPEAVGGDSILQPNDTFRMDFRIGLKSLSAFNIVLDVFGTLEGDIAVSSVDGVGIPIDITEEMLQLLAQNSPLYLPSVER